MQGNTPLSEEDQLGILKKKERVEVKKKKRLQRKGSNLSIKRKEITCKRGEFLEPGRSSAILIKTNTHKKKESKGASPYGDFQFLFISRGCLLGRVGTSLVFSVLFFAKKETRSYIGWPPFFERVKNGTIFFSMMKQEASLAANVLES